MSIGVVLDLRLFANEVCRDIGTAGEVFGDVSKLPTPWEIPW